MGLTTSSPRCFSSSATPYRTSHTTGGAIRWSSRFRAAGLVSFSGTLAVTDSDFHLDMPFPLLAKGFESRAEAEVNRWLDGQSDELKRKGV